MKYRHLTAFFLLVLSVSAAPGRSDAAIQRDFKVSKVGSDKSELLRVYEAVCNSSFEGDAELFDATNFHVESRISSTQFLVYPKRMKSTSRSRSSRVVTSGSQRIGGGGTAFGSGSGSGSASASLKVDYEKRYLLITDTRQDAVEGETISSIRVVNTGKIADLDDYSTPYGGSVRLLREVKLQKITKEDFVSRLRAGETWTLRNFTTEKCRNCMGRGNLGKLSDYARCPKCNGKGQFPVDYTVKW